MGAASAIRRCAVGLLVASAVPGISAQVSHAPVRTPGDAGQARTVILTVVDENGMPVAGAQVTIQATGRLPIHAITDYAGRCAWLSRDSNPYAVRIEKGGFYRTSDTAVDPQERSLHLALTHEQMVQQQVDVRASAPGIDTQQVSDAVPLNTPEIVNIPFPTNRDIRNLLPFSPGVVADSTGQVHVAGGETYMTLDTLDGFDMRSPIYGTLDLRVSTDAVRSIDTETTRYPVQYGRSTGGIIAFNSGMGDNKFRYNATDFVPSFRSVNGVRFDKLVPRLTFSGPVVRNRAWFFDGVEAEYDEGYIPGLPSNADTNHLARGGNLIKFQVNLGPRNSLSTGLLVNDYHSPYEGLSTLTPQQSTDNHDIIAWLPYLRDEQSFSNGIMLDSGFGVMRYREGFEPHGSIPFELTPETALGSDFENLTTRSQRLEGYGNVYFPPRHLVGHHEVRAGLDVDHIDYDGNEALAPVNYLREDKTLVRRSLFPLFAPFAGDNLELGAYAEDRWTPRTGWLLEPGLRYDWDEIIRRPLFSPRIAFTWSPPGMESTTKLTGGVGLYYEHTQLEQLTRAQAGVRYDTYFAADGTTPVGPPQETVFTENHASLREAHALNWSIGVQHKLPGDVYLGANFLQKRVGDIFVYANQNGTGAMPGNYVLTNNRQDHYHSVEMDAKRTFSGGYTLFGSYTRSSATTNSALDYVPTIPLLGIQQSGPLAWDTPNRLISWGWLPAWAPKLPTVRKNWDFVYTFDWHSGFPFDSVNASEDLIGVPGSHRFPDYFSFDPGLEWRFHFHGRYFGLRGLVENITNSSDPYVVNNNVDSSDYLQFTQPLGRAFTTRIRLIQASR